MDSLSDGNSAAPASTGPTTFAEAFASDASSAPDPSASATTPPAAAQPAQDAAGTTPAAREPFIPRARFDEVNTQLGQLKEWKDKHGWAETVDRRSVEQATQIAQRFQQDPGGYIRDLLTEAVGNPQLAPIVRSEVARLLGQRPAAAPAPVDLTPLPVEMTDGQTRNLFTAEQLQAFVQQELAKVREEFKPAMQSAAELQAEREDATAQRQAKDFATGALGELQALPGFKEHAKEIAAALDPKALRLASDHPAEVTAAAYRAYATLVLPKLNQSSQSQLLDTLQRNAVASRSPNPGSAAPSAPGDVRSFNDRRLEW